MASGIEQTCICTAFLSHVCVAIRAYMSHSPSKSGVVEKSTLAIISLAGCDLD